MCIRDSFGIVSKLEYYSEEELTQIIDRTSRVYNIVMDDDAKRELARRSRGTPRIANRLFRRVRDFSQFYGDATITRDRTIEALERLKVDNLGLDDVDHKYLLGIIHRFKGGPVGLEAIAASVSYTHLQTNWNDEITIDAGSLNNVQEGMAVCDSKGMIGVVSHVTEISSTVSLLTSENPSNQIPVMIINGDQTIYGLLKNYDVNKKVLNITLLSGIDKLEKNAKVYTSGLGGDGKCPKGIYIGKAKKLVTQSDGTTMTLTVKMAAQFKDLSYVSVVKKVNGNEE